MFSVGDSIGKSEGSFDLNSFENDLKESDERFNEILLKFFDVSIANQNKIIYGQSSKKDKKVQQVEAEKKNESELESEEPDNIF